MHNRFTPNPIKLNSDDETKSSEQSTTAIDWPVIACIMAEEQHEHLKKFPILKKLFNEKTKAVTYFRQKNYERSLQICDELLKASDKVPVGCPTYFIAAFVYLIVGSIYYDRADNKNAERNYKVGIETLEIHKNECWHVKLLDNLYEALEILYRENHDFKAYLETLRKHLDFEFKYSNAEHPINRESQQYKELFQKRLLLEKKKFEYIIENYKHYDKRPDLHILDIELLLKFYTFLDIPNKKLEKIGIQCKLMHFLLKEKYYFKAFNYSQLLWNSYLTDEPNIATLDVMLLCIRTQTSLNLSHTEIEKNLKIYDDKKSVVILNSTLLAYNLEIEKKLQRDEITLKICAGYLSNKNIEKTREFFELFITQFKSYNQTSDNYLADAMNSFKLALIRPQRMPSEKREAYRDFLKDVLHKFKENSLFVALHQLITNYISDNVIVPVNAEVSKNKLPKKTKPAIKNSKPLSEEELEVKEKLTKFSRFKANYLSVAALHLQMRKQIINLLEENVELDMSINKFNLFAGREKNPRLNKIKNSAIEALQKEINNIELPDIDTYDQMLVRENEFLAIEKNLKVLKCQTDLFSQQIVKQDTALRNTMLFTKLKSAPVVIEKSKTNKFRKKRKHKRELNNDANNINNPSVNINEVTDRLKQISVIAPISQMILEEKPEIEDGEWVEQKSTQEPDEKQEQECKLEQENQREEEAHQEQATNQEQENKQEQENQQELANHQKLANKTEPEKNIEDDQDIENILNSLSNCSMDLPELEPIPQGEVPLKYDFSIPSILELAENRKISQFSPNAKWFTPSNTSTFWQSELTASVSPQATEIPVVEPYSFDKFK